MKRHARLLQLSREHYGALKLARDARRAAESAEPGEVAALAQRVVQVFPVELDPHFCVEEQGILVLLAQAGQHELVERTLADHTELRRLARSLAEPDAATLLRFADLLGTHVRFEEREVFEAAQARLDIHSIST
ncbi:MAG: hemerythrin domain-containing protein [Sulfuritalea sp.]|jgi:hemerythrin-like domain-containing protein|nr:hemerythrin domain-containing protein [Sulfuritalea sp.]